MFKNLFLKGRARAFSRIDEFVGMSGLWFFVARERDSTGMHFM
jgi:hypothetical protein